MLIYVFKLLSKEPQLKSSMIQNLKIYFSNFTRWSFEIYEI